MGLSIKCYGYIFFQRSFDRMEIWQNYLENRSFVVHLGKATSTTVNIPAGSPRLMHIPTIVLYLYFRFPNFNPLHNIDICWWHSCSLLCITLSRHKRKPSGSLLTLVENCNESREDKSNILYHERRNIFIHTTNIRVGTNFINWETTVKFCSTFVDQSYHCVSTVLWNADQQICALWTE